MSNKQLAAWEFKTQSYQIADTGDYDGHYELTNGAITLWTKDDDEETERFLKLAAHFLNKIGINLSDAKVDDLSYQVHLLEMEKKQLQERVKELEAEQPGQWVKGLPQSKRQHFAKVKSMIEDDVIYDAVIWPIEGSDYWWCVGKGFKFDAPPGVIIAHLDLTGGKAYELEKLRQWKMEAVELQIPIIAYCHKHLEVNTGDSCTALVIAELDRLREENATLKARPGAVPYDQFETNAIKFWRVHYGKEFPYKFSEWAFKQIATSMNAVWVKARGGMPAGIYSMKLVSGDNVEMRGTGMVNHGVIQVITFLNKSTMGINDLPKDYEGVYYLDESGTAPLTQERADLIREANNRDLEGVAANEWKIKYEEEKALTEHLAEYIKQEKRIIQLVLQSRSRIFKQQADLKAKGDKLALAARRLALTMKVHPDYEVNSEFYDRVEGVYMAELEWSGEKEVKGE